MLRNQSGFTLPEMLVAVAFFLIASAMALALGAAVVPAIRADGQASRLMAAFQYGRELAISTRRDVAVRFNLTTHTVDIVRLELDGTEVPLQTLAFEYNVRFHQFADMGDTPEAFGAGAAVDFGGATGLRFTPDGTFVDETLVPINGTIFLAVGDKRESARAVTLTGSTGRARFYKWSAAGEAWEGGWVAR